MTLFEKIASGQLPSHTIWEDQDCMAILNIYPDAPGHTLVIPKKNWGDNLFHLPLEQYQQLLTASKQVAALLEEKMPCERIVMSVFGFDVPHVHVHLIPATQGFKLGNNTSRQASQEELEKVATQIRG